MGIAVAAFAVEAVAGDAQGDVFAVAEGAEEVWGWHGGDCVGLCKRDGLVGGMWVVGLS